MWPPYLVYFFSSLFLTWWLRRNTFSDKLHKLKFSVASCWYQCITSVSLAKLIVLLLFLQSSWCVSQDLSYWFIYWNCAYIRKPKTFPLIYFTALWKEKDNFVHFSFEFSENVGLCSGDFLLWLSPVRARRPSRYLRKKWHHMWRHFKVVCPYR